MKKTEKAIETFLLLCSRVSIITTASIVVILVSEAWVFFREVSIVEFLTDTVWTPLFTDKHFGILPLVCGTLLTTFIAVLTALPMGLTIAIFLNEYVPKDIKLYIKSFLEILAAIPTVVYGFFALNTVTPILQSIFPSLPGFNALSAGLVMGIMIVPYVSSLSEDALSAVPKSLREAAYGMGCTPFQTAFKVMLPAASSGIMAAVILAISRAIGETMIVAIASGQEPKLTFDPMSSAATITTYIVQVSSGDVPHNSIEFKSIFAAGLTLFILTFILNNISFWIRNKIKYRYE